MVLFGNSGLTCVLMTEDFVLNWSRYEVFLINEIVIKVGGYVRYLTGMSYVCLIG